MKFLNVYATEAPECFDAQGRQQFEGVLFLDLDKAKNSTKARYFLDID